MTPKTEGPAVARQTEPYDFDFIVIGSGFGGSVTAHRLTEKGYKVAVMEMGRRWTPENLPRTSWSIHRWFWRPGLALRGFFNMRFFRHVTILHGCAVGGGSITYACTLLRPPDKVWDNGFWAGLADWKAEMPQHYDTASRMLGVTENRILGPGDLLLKRGAEAIGVGDTFYRTSVGIFQAPEGEPAGQTYPDPYFGGEGPERTTCNGCGGCMMGCRYGAKNTLDKNYLYLAEKRGAAVFPETKVVDVRPLRRQARRQRRLRSCDREVHRIPLSPSAALHLPRRGLLRVVAGHNRASLPPEVERLAAAHQRPAGQTHSHQLRVAHRRPRTRQQRRPVERRGHRLGHLH